MFKKVGNALKNTSTSPAPKKNERVGFVSKMIAPVIFFMAKAFSILKKNKVNTDLFLKPSVSPQLVNEVSLYGLVNKRTHISIGQASKDGLVSLSTHIRFWKRTLWAFNVAKWKRRLIRQYFSEYQVRFLPLDISVYSKDFMIRHSVQPAFLVWGMTQPFDLEEYASENGIPIWHVEDGFVRSIGLGASHTLPFSLCVDKKSIYYDSSCSSDLETLLQTYDFDSDVTLMDTARSCIAIMKSSGLSKYNEVQTDKARHFYGPKTRTRILVLGQVEDDGSLIYGCNKILSNVELIEFAYNENPDAQIIYKPHPDVMTGQRKEVSNPATLSLGVEILPFIVSLKDALSDVDRVYTLTSLAGFEAVIHGVPVTTVGAPFYAGWGLTDDRQPVARRSRTLTLEEVFAGAYLLYPRYINLQTGKKSNLPEIMTLFLEQLEEIRISRIQLRLDSLRPVNLATRQKINPRYIYKSTAETIAIVSDDPEALLLAQEFVRHGKKVSFITTRDALANDILLPAEYRSKITVGSFHKLYGVPFSVAEKKAVSLIKNFSKSFMSAVDEVKDYYLNDEMILALGLGFEDFIYSEALRFYGAKACLMENDATLLFLDESNLDVIRSFVHHAKIEKTEGQLFIAPWDKTSFSDLLNEPPAVFSATDERDVKGLFSSIWHDSQQPDYNDFQDMHNGIAICGNVDNANYAYSPASLKLMEVCNRKNSNNIYFSSVLLSGELQGAVKSILMKENVGNSFQIYNGCLNRYKAKYPQKIFDMLQEVCDSLCNSMLNHSRLTHTEELLEVFRGRIQYYFSSKMPSLFLFISEASRIFDNIIFFASSMDRIPISRILSAIARSKQIPSIGIQPQIISTSLRYFAPSVDIMGVIDTAQMEVYKQLGASQSRLRSVGAVNLISRLLAIEEWRSKASGTSIACPSIFFAMQHSNHENMRSIALALKEICTKHNFKLVVKPHPHQEVQMVHEIREIFAGCNNVKIVPKDSDTYEWLAQCSLVVGLFSSVLLEAAVNGIDVIVASFSNVDNSVNFAQIGLALEARDLQTLEYTITDIISKGSLSKQLKRSRNEYLLNNPQLQKPYSLFALENFIETSIDSCSKIEKKILPAGRSYQLINSL